jgi:hypothetical protein
MSPDMLPAARQRGTPMRLILAAALLMLPNTPAMAGDKTAGWAKWVERAERIEAAMLSGEENFKPRIKEACTGVTGTVVSQGFQFPYWAQGLIQLCAVVKDDWRYSYRKPQCKDAKRVIAILNKATPVPEAPRADIVAKSIATILQMGYDNQCKRWS